MAGAAVHEEVDDAFAFGGEVGGLGGGEGVALEEGAGGEGTEAEAGAFEEFATGAGGGGVGFHQSV